MTPIKIKDPNGTQLERNLSSISYEYVYIRLQIYDKKLYFYAAYKTFINKPLKVIGK